MKAYKPRIVDKALRQKLEGIGAVLVQGPKLCGKTTTCEKAAESLGGRVYHYRDKNGAECDAVVHLRDGRYGLIEIKLGATEAVEYGASTLKKVANKLDTTKMKQPSFLMVLTGVGRYAYKREDGVLVVPIGCLKD